MSACAGGATPKAAAPDQAWLDIAAFIVGVPANVRQPITWAISAWAASLLRVQDICDRNADPPSPLTAQDIIESTASAVTGGALGENKVFRYIGDWLQYDLFLRNCDCIAPAPPSGGMCPYTAASWSLAPGAATAPVSYDIPQASYDAWQTAGSGASADWRPTRQWSFTGHSVATTQHFLEWSSDGTTWHIFEEIPSTSSGTLACSSSGSFLPAPRMPRTGLLRARNNSAVTFAVTNYNYCFCTLLAPPPPNNIPTRDPGTPDLPPGLCADLDICAAINDINRRLRQLSELVTLMQRYQLPFEIVPGAVHSSLSGRGSFAVSRLIGMRVDVTSHVQDHPDLEGNPPYVWDQGWMSILTEDDMLEEKRISQTHYDWLPKGFPMARTFGYDLRPGTVVTFTDLQAET